MTTPSRARWIAPIAALALAIGAPAAITSVANADPSLPEKTAEELLESIAAAEPVAFSGTVSQTVDLGLPDLSALEVVGPGGHGSSASPFDPMMLVTGTNTWQVWTDGDHSAKLALQVSGGEYSFTTNGSDAWFWDSAAAQVHRVSIPSHGTGHTGTMPEHAPVTPGEFAEQALEHIEPTTTVETSGTRMVAGRPAYELVLTPQDPATKIGTVRLAVDSETSLPLWFQITSTAGTPAVDVGFTDISYALPNPSIFTFSTPAGAEEIVTELPSTEDLEGLEHHGQLPDEDAPPGSAPHPSSFTGAEPTVVGEGWSAVVVLPAPDPGAAGHAGPPAGDGFTQVDPEDVDHPEGPAGGITAVLDQLPTISGDWGSGKIFEGTVFSALLADDGRIAIGAVGPDSLTAALTAAP
ncbi:MAG: hypothetical protein Q4G64_08070 [bacterium]|nr:hypothetical protein [bacterium]